MSITRTYPWTQSDINWNSTSYNIMVKLSDDAERVEGEREKLYKQYLEETLSEQDLLELLNNNNYNYTKAFFNYQYQPEGKLSRDISDDDFFNLQRAWDDLISNHQDVIGLSVGLDALDQAFESNIVAREFDYAKGNYVERRVGIGYDNQEFKALLEDFLDKRKIQYDKIEIQNSDIDLYNSSIKADIYFKYKNKAGEEKNAAPPLEVKTGIDSNYQLSHFDLGGFSNEAFKANDKQAYNTLIDNLQENFRDYIKDYQIRNAGDNIDQFLVEWAIKYIDWRLRAASFPVFRSDDYAALNLSSEIIKGFWENPLGTIEYVLHQFAKYDTLNRRNRKFETIQAEKVRKAFGTNIDNYIFNREELDQAILADETLLDDLVKRGIKIAPYFNMRVWYGKK